MIEGLWSMQVRVPNGMDFRPGGVTVFETGRIFGGDSGFFWTGSYQVNQADQRLRARVRVQRYNNSPNFESVFGIGMNDYELDVESGPLRGTSLAAIGRLVRNPDMAITMDFQKQTDLP